MGQHAQDAVNRAMDMWTREVLDPLEDETSAIPTRFPGDPCDKCDGKYVLRRNSLNGSKFLGCDNFPKCKNTRKYSGKKPDWWEKSK